VTPALHSIDPEAQEFIKTRLQVCSNDHGICSNKADGPLPKRVIDVQYAHAGVAQLRETIDECASYVALSHCWGKSTPAKLVEGNLEGMKIGFRMNMLPFTMSDAIMLAWLLNIPYIWIDALCIVQDSVEDWEIESLKMADYYANATLTIAATLSASGNEPFLCKRSDGLAPLTMEMRSENGLETTYPVLLWKEPKRVVYGTESIGPLALRAWTWQENALSRRVAHFTDREIIFECRTETASETGLSVPPFVKPNLCQGVARLETDPFAYWYDAVEAYSRRQLTFQSDRLPAISSVASHIAALTGVRYLAGLWERDLPQELLWMTASWSFRMPRFPNLPALNGSPSWTWSSISGWVLFCRWPTVLHFSVEHVECTVPGLNPFGVVSQGLLRLRGPVVEAILRCPNNLQPNKYYIYPSSSDAEPQGPLSWSHDPQNDLNVIPRVQADCPLQQTEIHDMHGSTTPTVQRISDHVGSIDAPVLLLHLATVSVDVGSIEDRILVLGRTVERPGCCVRLGIMREPAADWFEKGQTMSIDII